MVHYLHYIETESEFINKRTNDYKEPWVSLTTNKNGDVDSFVVNPSGASITFYYLEEDGDGSCMWSDFREEQKVTSVDLANSAVTIGEMAFTFSYDWNGNYYWAGPAYYEYQGGAYVYYARTSSAVSVGDTAVVYHDDSLTLWLYDTDRNDVRVGTLISFQTEDGSWYDNTPILFINNLPGEPLNRVDYNKGPLGVPFTLEILSDGAIKTNSYSFRQPLLYRVNDGVWEACSDGKMNITVHSGDTVQIKGSAFQDFALSSSTCTYKASGNIMSLKYGENFADVKTLEYVPYGEGGNLGGFIELFANETGLTDASKLLLPATTLSYGCYRGMFRGCTNLTAGPKLPATTLAEDCYVAMFRYCSSLTTVPDLPATTLTENCYDSMFDHCTSLTTAPSLPATTLASECYQSMFNGCTSLTSAPSLPATTLTDTCYGSMFEDCTNLTSAPELPATTLADGCYQYMFQGCTGLTTAPELPATTLAGWCYDSMFQDCTSLTTAPELPAITLATSCYGYMFSNCTSLNYIKCLATDISASTCTSDWVSGVQTTSGTFVKAPSMSSWPTGASGIPNNWTVEDAS